MGWDVSRRCPCLPRCLDVAGARAVYAVADAGRMQPRDNCAINFRRCSCHYSSSCTCPLFLQLLFSLCWFYFLLLLLVCCLRPIYATTAAFTSAQYAAAASAPAVLLWSFYAAASAFAQRAAAASTPAPLLPQSTTTANSDVTSA